MKFSSENEDLLKKFFAEDKNRDVMLLTTRERVENLKSELFRAVESEYSTLMDACGVLDELWDQMENLKKANEDTSKLSKELLKDIVSNRRQGAELVQCNERIGVIQRELGKIEEYVRNRQDAVRLMDLIEAAEQSETSGSTDDEENISPQKQNRYFNLTQAIMKMDETIGLFKKYYFFGSFYDELRKIKERLETIIRGDIERFLNQNWAALGKRIEITNEFRIFEDVKARRRDICDERTYETIYCIRRLEYMEPMIRELIRAKRTEMLALAHKHCTTNPDNTVCFYIGNILLSHFLAEIFPSLDTFYTQIFASMQSLESCEIGLVSKLRLVAEKLRVSSVELDSTVESIVYKYFERELGYKALFKLTNKEILEKVLKGHTFLTSINSYESEFDGIFLRSVDNAFVHILNELPDELFDRISCIEGVIEKLKSRDPHFKDYTFECMETTRTSVNKMAEKEVGDLKAFAENNSTEEVVKKIISYKEIKNKDFRSKFVEILKEKANKVFEGKSKEDKVLFIDAAKRNMS